MKDTGVIRKIDELGRLVIPKEIRRNLNIKNGDDVQIYVENNLILLKKYEKMLSIKEISEKLVKEFSKYTKANIMITDKSKVIVSNNNNLINLYLDSAHIDLILERKPLIERNLILSGDMINTNYYLIPIILNTDAIGSIIISDDIMLNEKDKLLIELLRSMILLNLY